MHVVWVNEDADFTGGCEKYIFQSVTALADKAIKSTLLYQVGSPKNPAFMKGFDQAFPMVDLKQQLKEIAPDLIYVHSLNNSQFLQEILDFPCKKIRFFHDQRAFCLREHKYTTLGHQPCSKKLGMGCYTCLGFLKPVNTPWKVGLRTLKPLQDALAMNRGFDQIIVGSEYMAEQLRLHDFDPEKVTVVPLFSAQAETTVVNTDALTSPNQQKTSHKPLLFVGQLVRGKGLDTLLKALAASTEKPSLLICGSGKMEQDYRDQVQELGLSSRVSFLGQQNSEQLQALYRKSSAVVIPSRAPETFCLVGLEALLNGTPVIASNTGGMNEWFKPNINGLAFSANNDAQLASVIDRLFTDTKLQKRLRDMIQRSDFQRFAPASHIHQVHALMTQMMEAA